MAKPPTPQGISRLLAKAGFTRAEGGEMLPHNSGFQARADWRSVDSVIVRYASWSIRPPEAVVRARLDEYTRVITETGYAVTMATGPELIVTAPKSTEGE